MRRTWDRSRVITVLAAIKDSGMTIPKMSRASGVTRSTLYRWASGEVQPDYDKVYSLAYAAWPRFPELARELVEASGYAWAEPQAPPEPVPELDDDTETLEALRSAYRDDPEMLRRVARSMRRAEAKAAPGEQAEGPSQRAG